MEGKKSPAYIRQPVGNQLGKQQGSEVGLTRLTGLLPAKGGNGW